VLVSYILISSKLSENTTRPKSNYTNECSWRIWGHRSRMPLLSSLLL